jgi:PAS domain S-box-containing protein
MLKGTAFKVLLVENNLAVAELLQELLLEANEVRVTLRPIKRVSEAIEALEREDFDAILLDLSLPDRKQAEEALKQQKKLLQTIFDHIPVMVTFFDAKGKLQLVNRELEQVLGWSLAELRDSDMLLTLCYPNSKYRQKVLNFMQRATGKWQGFKTRTRDGRLLDTCWANIQLRDGTLSISHSIVVKKHNGKLYCNSQLGQGSEFTIELPL